MCSKVEQVRGGKLDVCMIPGCLFSPEFVVIYPDFLTNSYILRRGLCCIILLITREIALDRFLCLSLLSFFRECAGYE